MTPEQKTEPRGSKGPSTTPAASANARKAWKPKTPIDVVLDQIRKQEDKVAGIKALLTLEEKSLTKLLQAKKVLEA